MAWVMSKPLVTTNTPEQNECDKKLWEAEDLGGITEDNNRLPVPVVWLLLLTALTAFAITFPLWGLRPTPAIYVNYVAALDDPAVQAAANDDDAMAKVMALSAQKETPENQQMVNRHPVSMDTLRALAPQIKALQQKGVDLRDYFVVENDIVQANYEGNWRKDGSRERFAPWWDIGYTIDIFYLLAFFTGVVMVVKRLPPSSWQPTHGHGH